MEAWSGFASSIVTGWAALRLYGGGFFDGIQYDAVDGRRELDVNLLIAHTARPSRRPGVALARISRMPPAQTRFGIPCAPPDRAVLDAMNLCADDRAATVVMDMAAAAEITSVTRVGDYLAAHPPRTGGRRMRSALLLASERSLSPRETELRLIWTLDAHLPPPLVNQPVYSLTGTLIGVADLFDPIAGVAGEYDGAVHRTRLRHRRDVQRNEGFRSVGIETFTVVAGDDVRTVVGRIRAARHRALFLPPQSRRWVIGVPDPNDEPDLSLDDRLNHREHMSAFYASHD